MKFIANMPFPPSNLERYKITEHSKWYAGDPDLLAQFYETLKATNPTSATYMVTGERFWARQINNRGTIVTHVPIAGDIAETSADLLFGEQPIVDIVEAKQTKASDDAKNSQDALTNMLTMSGFYNKIIEAAEASAALGGIYVKLAWDLELSVYPIPVIEQPDNAYPEFKFGILTKVDYVQIVKIDKKTIYRLVETYTNDGNISYELFRGSSTNLGQIADLITIPETEDIEDITTRLNQILCVFVPNMLPNRLDRNSYFGRSDYQGVELLMDNLDETYSNWIKDITIAQGKVHIPKDYLKKDSNSGNYKYNPDDIIYAELDMDPTVEGNKITVTQFAIRATEFEKTSLNLIERIVTSAGYSPQSFGLSIEGRAESGTALNMRERKSFFTKGKKERYWQPALRSLIQMMMALYKFELNGKVDPNLKISVTFSDGITNDLNEKSAAVEKISNAVAASTYTKVKLLHPEWGEDEVKVEVDLITKENGLGIMEDPDKTINLNTKD